MEGRYMSMFVWKDWLVLLVVLPLVLPAIFVIYAILRATEQPLPRHSPRPTLDTLQRLFYSARETAAMGITHFVATMNSDTLKELGREVAMGGINAPASLSAACAEAATKGDGPTGVELWDVALTIDSRLDDSEIKLSPIESTNPAA
jgi:hypothetical protein